MWFALAGAAVVSALVYAGRRQQVRHARSGWRSPGPRSPRCSRAGRSAVELTDNVALDRMRFWQVGSLAAADMATVAQVAPFLAGRRCCSPSLPPARSTPSRSATTPPAASAPG